MSSQELVLRALADTFIPSLSKAEIRQIEKEYEIVKTEFKVSKETRLKFYEYQPSDLMDIGQKSYELLLKVVPKDKMGRLDLILRMLNTSAGTLLLCGYMKPFPSLTRHERELAILGFAKSWLPDFRQLFRVFDSISMFNTYGATLEHPPHWPALKYSGGRNIKAIQNSDTFNPEFIDIKEHQHNGVVQLSCDVVVVGSGCGGGLIAAELSKEGYDVIVVDHGYLQKPNEAIGSEAELMPKLYELNGGFYSEDMSIQTLVAKTFGGGSTVNWSACFQPPQSLREEWKTNYGLDHITTDDFQSSVDKVWKRVGASVSAVKLNGPNTILMNGCDRLGYDCQKVYQNTANNEHNCATCGLGCPTRQKQSTIVTWLKDAADHGCRFLEGAHVESITHSKNVASGVIASKEGVKIQIKSKKVVASCGSMQTPALLMRSKFKSLNSHVGKNLRLHPVVTVSGVFPDREVTPFEGSILTTVSNVVANLDGTHYGAKIEVPAGLPVSFATTLKWNSAADHKKKMLMYPHTATFIVLTRDKDSTGSIWVDGDGNCRYNWKLGKFDGKSCLAGVEKSVMMLLAAGAAEIIINHPDLNTTYRRPSGVDLDNILSSNSLKEYILKVRSLDPSKMSFFAAHQMGTCRMASTPEKGAVNQRGQLYGVSNVYVCDASLFPTSSGVK
jgi:choline dehydrogenase-like flavoprotein